MQFAITSCLSLLVFAATTTWAEEPMGLPAPTTKPLELIPAGDRESAETTHRPSVRQWTLTDGRRASARLIDWRQNAALLEGENENRVLVPMEYLSPEDIAHLAQVVPDTAGIQADRRSAALATLLVNLQDSPLIAIENSLDLLDQVSGKDLVATLEGQSTKTVTQNYTVSVPQVEIVTEMQERLVRRCIRGRWVCVRETVPVQRRVEKTRQETRSRTVEVPDEDYVEILNALATYTTAPTTAAERTQIKRLLLQAYAILSARGED